MGVDGSVLRSSSEALAFSVGNMFAVMNVAFGESKVDEEYFVRSFVESHAEVVRFDISMY
jgi:hypothetical protein